MLAEIFVLIVMICDGYLVIRPPSSKNLESFRRFFKIAAQLPMELQMMLSERVFLSPETIILTKNVEDAIRKNFEIFKDSRE